MKNDQLERASRQDALRVSLIYAVAGALWILFSDQALLSIFPNPDEVIKFQTYKGWFFILVTALLVYLLVLRISGRLRRSQKKLMESEEQLRQSQKMQAVGQLAGGVAHDFNNIVQVIAGSSAFALESIDTGHPAREYLTDILRASERAASLARQLLTFSRRESLRPEYVDINRIIDSVTKLLDRTIGKHISLRIDSNPLDRSVYADPGQLEQVILNLCVNARDAMPDGGVITIGTRDIHMDLNFCRHNPWGKVGRYVQLTISDTGSGIDPEIRDHIFEPFFTTKAVGHGTGLGLATVYAIVQRMDGLIHVESEVGSGTVFYIYLPSQEKPAGEKVKPAKSSQIVRGNETILIAEDDDMVRNLTVRILDRAGYHIMVAEDGREAIDLYMRHADKIDLAILDVVMPNKSGAEVLAEIRSHNVNLPILLTSGYSFNDFSDGLPRDDKIQVMQKPYKPHELLHAIKAILTAASDIA